MTPDISGAGPRAPSKTGRHRVPRKKQSILVRTLGGGRGDVCIGLVSEMNVPDADALSIVLPAGNGNATQINILEGNVFDPQLGLGGDGGNTSHNSTIGNLIFGLGNDSPEGTSGGGLFGPIALGGATGNGNVTQINILSYNIFNPQFSINGANVSNNTTINNVAINNGNDSQTTVTRTTGLGSTFFGGAIGNGNTTQLSFFSGNIFNPQFSLFGDNAGNNLAITNVAALNGNDSETSVTSGGGFGTALFGGRPGTATRISSPAFTSNIFNPQFSLLGRNESHNSAATNHASLNGNNSDNEVGSTGGLGNNTTVGTTGNGITTQYATANSNIFNDQLRLGLGGLLPSTSSESATLTNAQVTSGDGQLDPDKLLIFANQQQSAGTGTTSYPRPLSTITSRIRDAVKRTLGLNSTTSSTTGTADPSVPDTPAQPADDSTS